MGGNLAIIKVPLHLLLGLEMITVVELRRFPNG